MDSGVMTSKGTDCPGQLWFPGFWRHMDCAPKNATDVKVQLKDGTELIAHYADGDGDGLMPPYCGWFTARVLSSGALMYYGQIQEPVAWKPLTD